MLNDYKNIDFYVKKNFRSKFTKVPVFKLEKSVQIQLH